MMLWFGFFLNIPDYKGHNASFAAGVMSGHATIDSVRAALSFGQNFNLSTNASAGLWEYSGGAFASEWAAELQVQYAPEVNFIGTALGGLTPNITAVLLKIDGTDFAYLIPNAVIGLTSQYPNARAELKAKLNPTGPYNASTFLSVLECGGLLFNGQNITNYFVINPSMSCKSLGVRSSPVSSRIHVGVYAMLGGQVRFTWARGLVHGRIDSRDTSLA
jgi:hypothetical protein